jgi:hypothetical protein
VIGFDHEDWIPGNENGDFAMFLFVLVMGLLADQDVHAAPKLRPYEIIGELSEGNEKVIAEAVLALTKGTKERILRMSAEKPDLVTVWVGTTRGKLIISARAYHFQRKEHEWVLIKVTKYII